MGKKYFAIAKYLPKKAVLQLPGRSGLVGAKILHPPQRRVEMTLWRILLILSILLTAAQCSLSPADSNAPAGELTAETPTPTPKMPPDLLDTVKERGYLKVAIRVWPDSSFSPPIFRNAFGALDGYEVDLARAVANGLNVELEMSESDPRLIAAGGWNDNWDIALAWLPVTDNAQQRLTFSRPYAFDSGVLVTHQNNQSIGDLQDLADKRVGVPAHSIYQQVLSGQAPSLQGQYIGGALPPNLQVIPYNRDGNAFRDLAQGDGVTLDAALHSRWAFNATVQAEFPLKIVQENIYPVPVGLAFDRSGIPSERLRKEINQILQKMAQDGSLAELAAKWYDYDILSPAGGE